LPEQALGLHGGVEAQAFEHMRLRPAHSPQTDALCRLVLLGMLPALYESDARAFGEALFDFNLRVGETFAPVQGGAYAGARVQAVVDSLRRHGVRGVGQSSWGPSVFAFPDDPDHSKSVIERLQQDLGVHADDLRLTHACNHGALVNLIQPE
jgi:predicted sugar kinase